MKSHLYLVLLLAATVLTSPVATLDSDSDVDHGRPSTSRGIRLGFKSTRHQGYISSLLSSSLNKLCTRHHVASRHKKNARDMRMESNRRPEAVNRLLNEILETAKSPKAHESDLDTFLNEVLEITEIPQVHYVDLGEIYDEIRVFASATIPSSRGHRYWPTSTERDQSLAEWSNLLDETLENTNTDQSPKVHESHMDKLYRGLADYIKFLEPDKILSVTAEHTLKDDMRFLLNYWHSDRDEKVQRLLPKLLRFIGSDFKRGLHDAAEYAREVERMSNHAGRGAEVESAQTVARERKIMNYAEISYAEIYRNERLKMEQQFAQILSQSDADWEELEPSQANLDLHLSASQNYDMTRRMINTLGPERSMLQILELFQQARWTIIQEKLALGDRVDPYDQKAHWTKMLVTRLGMDRKEIERVFDQAKANMYLEKDLEDKRIYTVKRLVELHNNFPELTSDRIVCIVWGNGKLDILSLLLESPPFSTSPIFFNEPHSLFAKAFRTAVNQNSNGLSTLFPIFCTNE